jgi:outer membrane lipoprotein-sorting protein
MRQMGLQRRAALLLTAVVVATAMTSSIGARDLFDEIYERGKPLEQSLKTIRAHFTEETTSSLLTRPLVAEGTLIVVRPSDILLTYTKPERKTLRLDAGHLLFVWPDRGLRESKDIREAQGRVQKYFVNKTPEELRKHFTIAAGDDKGRPGTWRIDMVPTRKQIQQGLARLELWVRQDTMTLAAMRMTFPGGDTKTMTFTDVVVNQPVSPSELHTP